MDTSQVSPADVRAQLERMLASETFRGAERSKTLLSFIVEETLKGRTDRLKDYTLGSEALGRGDQFDPRVDPIARVEASRLRSRLDMYYATEGAGDALRILLPKGGYVPQFEAHAVTTTTSRPELLPAQPAAFDPSPGPNRLRQRPWLLAGIAVGLGLLTVAVTSTFMRESWRAPAAPEVRAYIPTPPTTDPVSIAVSPDGRAIVFVATKGGRSQLWLRWIDSYEFRQLPGTDNASLPFWAPDSRSIGFFAESRIKRIDIDNEVVRELSTAVVPAGATWNRDGVILHPIVTDSPIFRTSVDGAPLAQVTELLPGQTGHRAPVFLPDGRRFLLYATGAPDVSGIYLGELGTTTIRRLLAADAPAVLAPPRHLLYLQGSKLLAREFDPETMTLVGEGVAVADGVITEAAAGLPAVSASATGTIVYRTGESGPQRQFALVDRAGRQLQRIGPAAARPSYASISPDGRRLAIQRTFAGNTDVSIFDVNWGTAARFTDDPQPDISPVWSPDGDRIVYASLIDGAFQLFVKRLDGMPARLLLRTAQSKQATDWSRNGNGSHLLFRTVAGANFDIDIWALPLDSDGKPGKAFPVVQSRFEERDAQFSPDGRWIAYHSNESGRHEIYVKPFPGPGERTPISTTGGAQVRWREDGGELFYLTLEGQLTAVPITVRADGRGIQPGAAEPLFHANVGDILSIAQHQYIVREKGQRFLIDTVVEQAAAPISLILNWNGPAE
jgi:Tol biopolymer transport system component